MRFLHRTSLTSYPCHLQIFTEFFIPDALNFFNATKIELRRRLRDIKVLCIENSSSF